MSELAKSVVYRHPCHCASASRAPEAGEDEEHRFDVDGQPFPWHITERGPAFSQLPNGLYVVRLEMFCIPKDASGLGSFAQVHGHAPVIGGLEFPWWITEAGLMYRASRKELATVQLGFFAESVDADCEIGGVGGEYEMGGNLIAHGVPSQ
jgi:hypothetical protein